MIDFQGVKGGLRTSLRTDYIIFGYQNSSPKPTKWKKKGTKSKKLCPKHFYTWFLEILCKTEDEMREINVFISSTSCSWQYLADCFSLARPDQAATCIIVQTGNKLPSLQHHLALQNQGSHQFEDENLNHHCSRSQKTVENQRLRKTAYIFHNSLSHSQP